MIGNFPDVKENINLHIKMTNETFKNKQRKNMPWHILIKLLKTNNKI